MAEIQGFVLTDADMDNLPPNDLLKMILSPSALLRHQSHMLNREKLYGNGATNYFADLDHWPGMGASGGRKIPTLVTHGIVMEFPCDDKPWRIALGAEHLFAQGFNMWPGESPGFPTARLLPNASSVWLGTQCICSPKPPGCVISLPTYGVFRRRHQRVRCASSGPAPLQIVHMMMLLKKIKRKESRTENGVN